MMKAQKTDLNEHGFTLMELLVAVTMTVFVIAGIYATFIAQQRSFTTQDQLAETQQSSKIAFNMLVNVLRDAGFGYPEFLTPSINGYSDSFTPTDSGTNGGPDSLVLVGGFRRVAELQNPTSVGQNIITINYLPGSGVKFDTNKRRFISIDGIAYAEITGCSLDNEGNCKALETITLDRNLNIYIPAGRPIYLMEDIAFCIANNELKRIIRGANANCTGTASSDTDVILQNTEDLQFAYAVDTNNDGVIDDQNNNNAFDSGDFINPPLPTNSKVMAVRVSTLARSMREDPNLDPASKPYFATGINLENNTTQDTDRFRRTIWSMVVMVRNPR